MLRQCLKVGHGLLHSFQFIIHNHPSIRRYTTYSVEKESLNKQRQEEQRGGKVTLLTSTADTNLEDGCLLG
jgi:hypothetical protein